MKQPYVKNIDTETLENDNFRKVVFTGDHFQLVLMSLNPGEEIGGEVHSDVDQFLRLESGVGKAIIEDVEYQIEKDFAIVIPAGSKHNLINTGEEKLKLYSIYAPPQHKPGTVEPKKIKEKMNSIHIKSFSDFLTEAKQYKGRDVYPNWINPSKDFGSPIKNVGDLEVGSFYVLRDPGSDDWHAEYVYRGKKGGKHRFATDDAEDVEFTDSELNSEIKNGFVIEQI
jgi:mannose-6-phosphate isomerase-like protein (cupin superfamily)